MSWFEHPNHNRGPRGLDKARGYAAGREAGAGSRLQAETSELIWQQGGPAAGRGDETGELGWRQACLET